MKITLIREGKVPADKRVAFSPQQCKQIQEDSQNQLSISIEPSEFRCYTDQEYKDHGIECSASLGQSDILIGIKEVPIDSLIPDKTYFFFSHTIKKQAHNRKLLQAILAKNITLIDYECLVNERGERVTAFGKYAGIVGAYNAIWTYGKKYKCFDLRRAKDCFDLADMETEYAKVNLPPIKIVLTGGGRVAGGAMGVLDRMGIAKVSPTELLEQNFDHPVYAALSSADYHERKDGGDFSKQDFYKDPTAFKSTFMHFAAVADMLIACAYWDPKAPRLFEKAAVGNIDFKIRVIADVTCDIDGSIPTTHRASTILDPVYDMRPSH